MNCAPLPQSQDRYIRHRRNLHRPRPLSQAILPPASTNNPNSLLKPDDDQYSLGGRVLKVSTFKVAPEHQGYRYGELLLKTLFDYVRSNGYGNAWVTVFERHASLVSLFEHFGFEKLESRTPLGEWVYRKSFRPSQQDLDSRESLDLHVRFGPPCMRLSEGQTFLVPIQPQYHRMLFPEFPEAVQWLFSPEPRPFGNALRKAYLCRSAIKTICPGSALLFYRSRDLRSVTAAAVADSVLRSQSVDEIMRFVGQRTVYSEAQVRWLAKSPVLAILFRQDHFLDEPASSRELERHGIIARAPQSIMTIRGKAAIEWLRARVGAQC